MQKKKILFVTGSISYGGAGKMMNYVAGICAKAYDTLVLPLDEGERPMHNMEGVTYLASLNVHKRGLINWCKTFYSIKKKVKEINPDILVAFVTDVAIVTRIATITMNHLTFVSAERGDPYTMRGLWSKLSKWAYIHSNFCFFQLERARDFYGKGVVSRSFVIPNAAFFNGEINCHKKEHNTIVAAGRYVHQKGFSYLIDAYNEVKKVYPEYKLIIYGTGPLKEEYERQINELGLNSSISLLGYTQDVANILRSAGIFVLPSLFEGIPNILIEAMLIGIPTISTNCTPGGPDFITQHGNRGILIPTADSKALSDAICLLISDQRLYESFENIGSTIKEELDPSKIDKQWLDAFSVITNS